MGDTWSGPVSLGPGLGFLPRVGPNGELYIAYWDYTGMGNHIELIRSFDGGDTLSSPLLIATRMDVWGIDGTRFPGDFRVPPLAHLAVDPNDGTTLWSTPGDSAVALDCKKRGQFAINENGDVVTWVGRWDYWYGSHTTAPVWTVKHGWSNKYDTYGIVGELALDRGEVIWTAGEVNTPAHAGLPPLMGGLTGNYRGPIRPCAPLLTPLPERSPRMWRAAFRDRPSSSNRIGRRHAGLFYSGRKGRRLGARLAG